MGSIQVGFAGGIAQPESMEAVRWDDRAIRQVTRLLRRAVATASVRLDASSLPMI